MARTLPWRYQPRQTESRPAETTNDFHDPQPPYGSPVMRSPRTSCSQHRRNGSASAAQFGRRGPVARKPGRRSSPQWNSDHRTPPTTSNCGHQTGTADTAEPNVAATDWTLVKLRPPRRIDASVERLSSLATAFPVLPEGAPKVAERFITRQLTKKLPLRLAVCARHLPRTNSRQQPLFQTRRNNCCCQEESTCELLQ